MESPIYSIVIPAYNEGQRIGASLEKIISYVSRERWQVEILVVNDGSTDNTVEIVNSFKSRAPYLRIVQNPGNRGKGYSVRNGMLHASGDLLLFSDADLSAPIYEAKKLFEAISAGADVAIGSRWLVRELQKERQPFHRELLGRAFNVALHMVLGLKYKDTQCGFKAFTREAAQLIFPNLKIERWGFDPEILFLARRLKLKVAEVPVEWSHDERSHISPFKDGVRMLGEMVKVRINSVGGKYSTISQRRFATPYS